MDGLAFDRKYRPRLLFTECHGAPVFWGRRFRPCWRFARKLGDETQSSDAVFAVSGFRTNWGPFNAGRAGPSCLFGTKAIPVNRVDYHSNEKMCCQTWFANSSSAMIVSA